MITKAQYEDSKQKLLNAFSKAGIVLTDEEKNNVEVADFGLGELEEIGLELITYVNTDKVCSKELFLLPWQICPEHRHPSLNGKDGKEETFRCRAGEVYLYVEGEAVASPKGKVPEKRKDSFTVWHEIVLYPGEQYTLYPNTLHWFQGGPDGAIVSEFSTHSTDDADIFTDPDIQRTPVVE